MVAALGSEIKGEKNRMQETTDWNHAPIFDSFNVARLILVSQMLHKLDVKADEFSASTYIPISSFLGYRGKKSKLVWSGTNHLKNVIFILIVHLGLFTPDGRSCKW